MIFLDPVEYLRDQWRTARKILDSGWRPDVLIALWRGGAAPGAAIHEFLKVHGVKLRHYPLKCGCYSANGVIADEVVFDCASEVFASIAPGERVLAVDDVFDTGKTAAAVLSRLREVGADARLACVYWKPGKNTTSFAPDYFARELGDEWVNFPHELEGLSSDEIAEKDATLPELF